MTTVASQITSPTIVYSIVYSGADQRKHQSSAPLAFCAENVFIWWCHHVEDDSSHSGGFTQQKARNEGFGGFNEPEQDFKQNSRVAGELRRRNATVTVNIFTHQSTQHLIHFTATHLKIRYSQISSTVTQSSNESQGLGYTTGYQDSCHHYSDIIMSAMASQITDCLLNRLFRRRSKKTPKFCVTGECPTRKASDAKNVSVWWRHHESGTNP